MNRRWWISWNEYEADVRPVHDPPSAAVLGWWVTGEGEHHVTLCAIVEAPTLMDLHLAIYQDWPQGDHALDVRFSEEKSGSWLPDGDRFPLSDWMKERVA